MFVSVSQQNQAVIMSLSSNIYDIHPRFSRSIAITFCN